MRRQYHSRPTARGLLIWDVHRLVELARGLPVEEVPLEAIAELEEPFWTSESGGPLSCREIARHAALMEESALQYPIILASDGRVMDGMHRVCKAWLRGEATIRAVRFEVNPDPDHIDVPLDSLPYDEPW